MLVVAVMLPDTDIVSEEVSLRLDDAEPVSDTEADSDVDADADSVVVCDTDELGVSELLVVVEGLSDVLADTVPESDIVAESLVLAVPEAVMELLGVSLTVCDADIDTVDVVDIDPLHDAEYETDAVGDSDIDTVDVGVLESDTEVVAVGVRVTLAESEAAGVLVSKMVPLRVGVREIDSEVDDDTLVDRLMDGDARPCVTRAAGQLAVFRPQRSPQPPVCVLRPSTISV